MVKSIPQFTLQQPILLGNKLKNQESKKGCRIMGTVDSEVSTCQDTMELLCGMTKILTIVGSN
jgi:hypothetical protein